jgi:hypothetical protein
MEEGRWKKGDGRREMEEGRWKKGDGSFLPMERLTLSAI